MRNPRALPPGVRRHGAGLQATAKVRGERSYAQFPINEKPSVIQAWQEDERARLRLQTKDRPRAGTLRADAAKYLRRQDVRALVDFAQREQHIKEWVEALGHRRRRSITAEMIEAQRDAWLTSPREVADDGTVIIGPYAAASINKRLRALSNLWTKLDGRRAPNPVADVRECEEPDPEARGLSYDVIDAILEEMPEHAVGVKKDGTRTLGKPRTNVAKVICTIYAYAGLTPEQVKSLYRSDFDPDAGTLRLISRRKGRKPRRARDRALPQLVPLHPKAIEAFKRFDQLGLWRRRYSNSTVHRGFTSACHRLGLKGIRVYDLRHSFLSVVYAETRDLRVTGVFGGHRTEHTTKRYTIAAVAPHVQAAADAVARRLASTSGARGASREEKH